MFLNEELEFADTQNTGPDKKQISTLIEAKIY